MNEEGPLVNNGERLYYLNLAHECLRQNKIEETKKNEEENFTMEFNFQPRITVTENNKYSNIQSRFYQQSNPVPKFKDENETFQPNKNTKTIEPKTEEDIKKMTNRLYSESKIFKENKEKLYQNQTKSECPFRPVINVIGKADPKYFMMRLEKWNKKMEEKLKRSMKEQKKLNFDINTGQKLFQPKVDDPVVKKLKRDIEDVHIDLYNKGLDYINHRKKIMKTDTREDLQQIENEKKAKINKLKEERDRYKREKQEKLEKEIHERTLKAKAEKEYIEKILQERINKGITNEKNKSIKDSNNKKSKEDIKDKKGKTAGNKKEKENTVKKIKIGNTTKKSTSAQKNNNKKSNNNFIKIPLSANKRTNTERTKFKTVKATKITNNNYNNMKNESVHTQNQKNKSLSNKKDNKKDKKITSNSKNKNNKIESILKDKKSLAAIQDKNIRVASKEKKFVGHQKRLKSSKNDKKNVMNINLKIDKKEKLKTKETTDNDVVSMGNKSKTVHKEKKIKK